VKRARALGKLLALFITGMAAIFVIRAVYPAERGEHEERFLSLQEGSSPARRRAGRRSGY